MNYIKWIWIILKEYELNILLLLVYFELFKRSNYKMKGGFWRDSSRTGPHESAPSKGKFNFTTDKQFLLGIQMCLESFMEELSCFLLSILEFNPCCWFLFFADWWHKNTFHIIDFEVTWKCIGIFMIQHILHNLHNNMNWIWNSPWNLPWNSSYCIFMGMPSPVL